MRTCEWHKYLSTAAPNGATSKGDSAQPSPPRWVQRINTAIENAPAETLLTYVALDAASIFTIFSILMQAQDAIGLQVPADFAVAFALARVVRKIRLPADIAVAGALAKLYPPLTQVRVSALWAKRGSAATSSGDVTSAPAATWLSDAATRASALMDTYGLAFLLSQRVFVGLPTVFLLYAALRAGVDVQAGLESWQLGALTTSVTGAAGVWAVSACAAAALYPGVIVGAAHIGTMLKVWRSRGGT